MLDDWEENLAVICANRTKDDELVIVHLGDCLWKERGEIAAAHTCYLVAEANFESYSDAARLCLVGADHWNCPRTFASPKTIQWTEFYEYSKVLGNSQFQLLTFQPYKLIYAHMLAEVGKVSDSIKYCQTISKLLKNLGRSAEVEMWKLSASCLEERLRFHQQGGYGTGLAPGKLVGKFFTSIDKSIHRMIGSPPLPSLSAMPENKMQQPNDYPNFLMAPKVTASQSTMEMPTLIPSASVETDTDWTGGNIINFHKGSVSESDFGRSAKQAQLSNAGSSNMKTKASSTTESSRFGSFGSLIFQKTLGWVSKVRPDKQAKLGEDNKFYYDENLKRWVENGVDPLPEEVAPPSPPIMTSFQDGQPDYNINSALKTQNSLPNEEMVRKPPLSLQHNSSIPSIPSSQNQFSARSRMGVRSRYVDTFNKCSGKVTASSSFLASPNQSIKPIIGGNFFVPTPLASTPETAENSTQNICETSSSGDPSSVVTSTPFVDASNLSHHLPLASHSMQKFSSMDTITHMTTNSLTTIPSRATSWSGSISDQPDSYTLVDKHQSSLSSDSKKSK